METHKNMGIDFDSFSSGQMTSKLWLCEHLEKIPTPGPVQIEILAGWYGLLGTILFARNRLPIRKLKVIDIDPDAIRRAKLFNENWIWAGHKFEAHEADINNYQTDAETDVVINTSTEHLSSDEWWDRIKPGTWVVLQGTNMVNPTHINLSENLIHFKSRFPVQTMFYCDEIEFKYVSFEFKRFMIIGRK